MRRIRTCLRAFPATICVAPFLFSLLFLPASAQMTGDPIGPPDPIPDPLPNPTGSEKSGRDRTGEETPPIWEELYRDSDRPWGLPKETARTLAERAVVYRKFTRKFSCTETARTAKYKGEEAGKEELRRYSYLLTVRPDGGFTEVRQKLRKNGKIKKEPMQDAERFPPAYAWAFLFSERSQGFFAYRDLGDYFDGFDWVREIQFKGSLRFTDGKDIREWEGIALVDAATFTPIEIQAEPIGQREHIQAMYRRWATSFNLVGLRFAPRPFGFRCTVDFRTRKANLTFPTALRYDTFRVVSRRRAIPWKASSRDYTDYRFFNVGTRETIGGEVDE